MTTKDFICYVVLGVPSDFIDELCDEFDVDFSEDDIKEILNMCAGGLDQEEHYHHVGDEIILTIYGNIIDSCKDVLDENKFGFYIDGRDSYLSYDGKIIYSKQDIERLMEQYEMEEAE